MLHPEFQNPPAFTPAYDPAYDIVVIGGGPGGSAAATLLARQGWQVLLLERERFPRHHVGESLLPASIPVLEELGALPAVEAEGFLKKWGATMVWGRDKEPWSWFFGETNQRYPHAYQVWRPRFDQLLLENAVAQGARVRQGCQVIRALSATPFPEGALNAARVGADAGPPPFSGRPGPSAPEAQALPGAAGQAIGSRTAGVQFWDEAGQLQTVPARFVVDASGQSALLGRQLNLRRWDESFRNLAVYAYYRNARRLPPPADANIFIEAYAHGWLWSIPLHNGQTSVGAVVDSRVGEEQVRRLGLASFLEEQIRQAPHTVELVAGARRVGPAHIVKDWSYACVNIAGYGYVLLGDAACFIDPLFSSGVHLALMSGVLAAAYATTALRRPEMAPAAAAVYQELYYKEYGHFRELARLFYSSNRTVESYFWAARRILEGGGEAQEGEDNAQVNDAAATLIADNVAGAGADYAADYDADAIPGSPAEAVAARHSFIQAVAGQPPRGYERVALERGEAPLQFTAAVHSVEEERARRQAQAAEYLALEDGDGANDAASDADADGAGKPPALIYQTLPRLRPGVRVAEKPVLADGQFEWGQVLISASHPEGLPCSPLVARLVSAIDGETSVADLLAGLAAGQQEQLTADQREQLNAGVIATLRILYVDGTIEELAGA